MRKVLVALFAVCFGLMGFVGLAQARVYEVERGDMLRYITQNSPLDIRQICAINAIANPNKIFVGQKIVFADWEDVWSARAFCKARIRDLPKDSLAGKQYRKILQDLKSSKISIGKGPGTDYQLVIKLAEARNGYGDFAYSPTSW